MNTITIIHLFYLLVIVSGNIIMLKAQWNIMETWELVVLAAGWATIWGILWGVTLGFYSMEERAEDE